MIHINPITKSIFWMVRPPIFSGRFHGFSHHPRVTRVTGHPGHGSPTLPGPLGFPAPSHCREGRADRGHGLERTCGHGWLVVDLPLVGNKLLIYIYIYMWLLYGYYMVIIWLLYGYYMVIIWLYGYYMVIIWLMIIIWLVVAANPSEK